jgi:hypothetical protein
LNGVDVQNSDCHDAVYVPTEDLPPESATRVTQPAAAAPVCINAVGGADNGKSFRFGGALPFTGSVVRFSAADCSGAPVTLANVVATKHAAEPTTDDDTACAALGNGASTHVSTSSPTLWLQLCQLQPDAPS